MKATRPLLLLALLAVFGSCSKATDEPVAPSPSPSSSAQPLKIALSGEIEMPEVDAQTARNLILTEGTSSSGKRIITPYFTDSRLPAILCIYDDFGVMSLSRVFIDVTPATSSNGKLVSRFRYYGALDQRKFIARRPDQTSNTSAKVTYKRDPNNSGVYVGLFVGLNPNGGEDTSLDIGEGSISYTHGGWETKLGEGIDYSANGANTGATRIIFGTTSDRLGEETVEIYGKKETRVLYEHHPLKFAFDNTIFDKKSGYHANPQTYNNVLTVNDLKLTMRGALLEVTVENWGTADVNVGGVRVGKFGGGTVEFSAPTSKKITRKNQYGQTNTFWEVDTPPMVTPASTSGTYDIKFYQSVRLEGKDPRSEKVASMKKIVYLPFVNTVTGRKQIPGTLEIFYNQTTGSTEQKTVSAGARPLKKQGILVTKKFTIN
nr:hypothetical protein [uncultured Porphyromonas sp.]